MIYYIDYATSSSAKKLAVAVNDGQPFLIDGTLLEFVSGTGNRHPSSDGQTVSLSAQLELFGAMGNRDPSSDGQSPSLALDGDLEPGKHYSSPGPNDIIVIESNFEPHNPYKRNEIIDVTTAKGITIETLPTRTTGKIKRRLSEAYVLNKFDRETLEKAQMRQQEMRSWVEEQGLTWHENDDMCAVEAIRWCYLDKQTTSLPKKVDLEQWEAKPLIEQFNAIRTDHLDMSHPLCKRMMKYMPISPLMNCDMDIQKVYVQNRKLQLTLVILTIIATLETSTREEFDRLLGLYAHGYPAIYRSSFIRRAIALADRATSETFAAWEYERRLVPDERRLEVRNAMQLVRRASRKLRRIILDGQSNGLARN